MTYISYFHINIVGEILFLPIKPQRWMLVEPHHQDCPSNSSNKGLIQPPNKKN